MGRVAGEGGKAREKGEGVGVGVGGWRGKRKKKEIPKRRKTDGLRPSFMRKLQN
jgi:hypothetical protein